MYRLNVIHTLDNIKIYTEIQITYHTIIKTIVIYKLNWDVEKSNPNKFALNYLVGFT